MPRKAPFLVYLEKYDEKLVHRSKHTREQYPRLLRSIWWTAQHVGIKRQRSPKCWTREEISMLVEARMLRMDGVRKANQSVRHELKVLDRFLRFCGNGHLASMLEWGDVTLPPDTVQNVRWISLDDAVRLRVQARDDGDYMSFMVLVLGLDVLLRVGEMSVLKVSDVRGDHVVVRQGKGRKDRQVRLLARPGTEIQDYLDTHRSALPGAHQVDHLLVYSATPSRPPSPYSEKRLGERVRELGKRCDPPIAVSPHDLRRSGGQHAYMADPSDRTVRELQAAYGHKTTEQTRRYIGADLVDQGRMFTAREDMYMRMYPDEFGQVYTRR